MQWWWAGALNFLCRHFVFLFVLFFAIVVCVSKKQTKRKLIRSWATKADDARNKYTQKVEISEFVC